MADKSFLEIFNEATDAAITAAQQTYRDNPDVWYPCGFAWVRIRPARGKFVKWLKEQEIGHVDDYLGGYTIWDPTHDRGQWMDAKYAGAVAFAAVLVKHGINACAEQRID